MKTIYTVTVKLQIESDDDVDVDDIKGLVDAALDDGEFQQSVREWSRSPGFWETEEGEDRKEVIVDNVVVESVEKEIRS